MGNSHASAATFVAKSKGKVEMKTVIIVGTSFGGRILCKAIQQLDPEENYLNVLLVDKQSNFEFICTHFMGVTTGEVDT